MPTPPPSSFLWNGRVVVPDDVAPGRLLLDYLRRDLRSVGTKEGCREGDCGACAVLLGELGLDGAVTYRAVPSCMVLVGHVAGRHVVTIARKLTPKAMHVMNTIIDANAQHNSSNGNGHNIQWCSR